VALSSLVYVLTERAGTLTTAHLLSVPRVRSRRSNLFIPAYQVPVLARLDGRLLPETSRQSRKQTLKKPFSCSFYMNGSVFLPLLYPSCYTDESSDDTHHAQDNSEPMWPNA